MSFNLVHDFSLVFRKKIVVYVNKAGYTATEVACGWAGAVMKKANSSMWAGAVMQKTPKNAENKMKKET